MIQAISGFFCDAKCVLKGAENKACLAGIAFLICVSTSGWSALWVVSNGFKHSWIVDFSFLAGGAAAGTLVAVLQAHPRRLLGLVPFGALLLACALVLAAAAPSIQGSRLLMGIAGALVGVPLCTAYLAGLPSDARGNGTALLNAVIAMSVAIAALGMFALDKFSLTTPSQLLWCLAAVAVGGAAVAWRILLRECLEQIAEIIVWPFYRIRTYGPGLLELPSRGPLLVIANHTAWFDPLWLAKIIPRPVTPMMTSKFYDLPVLRWLMTNVTHTIRVQAATFRREAPELDEAIRVLDSGGCVILFPEGFMKRRADQPLRYFAQGIWRILRQRPETPVVTCWIEGGWGSYMSYYNGPPLANKRMDWWRQIRIAVAPPQVLDPQLLEDQRATRIFLMQACLETRRFLDLEPLKLEHAASAKEDDTNNGEAEEEEHGE